LLSGSSVVAILGMKIFKVSDTKIGLLSAVSYFAGAVVWVISSFTTFGWMMYLGRSTLVNQQHSPQTNGMAQNDAGKII